MWASWFDVRVLNLAELLPTTSVYYLSREEAYRQLCADTGENFGYDAARWQQWGREHGRCFPGVGDVAEQGAQADRRPPVWDHVCLSRKAAAA